VSGGDDRIGIDPVVAIEVLNCTRLPELAFRAINNSHGCFARFSYFGIMPMVRLIGMP
jgi:hypothetical protein